MPVVIVDGQEVEFPSDVRMNGIQAARLAGVEIPHYCWHPGLSVVASCRMCLVETGRKDPQTGAIAMVPKLVPACQTPATDGTVFVTKSDKVQQARSIVEEDLLLRHPVDCPICDKAGECLLQDYHFQYGRDQRRADIKPFTSRRRPVGDTVTLFVDRCVMCSRCVRFTREITGTNELMIVNRGSHEEIDVFPGHPLANKMAGNVVDLCPVGALGDVDFLYNQRVWFMKRHAGVCSGCSTGCSIWIEENQDRIYRLKPRENPHINQWWMCDEGRYGYHHVHDPQRQTQLRVQSADGEMENIEWSQLATSLPTQLRQAGHIAVALSPFLTIEEAYLLASLIRECDPQALVGMGPVPTSGADERFPSGFTIRAEKCPNRRGVEHILAHFDGIPSFDEFLDQAVAERVGAIWISGGYPRGSHPPAAAERLASIRMRIVHDLFDSPLWQVATHQLPGATTYERAGSFVNAQDHLQSFDWAVRPPAGIWADGPWLWRLLQRPGMYQSQQVLAEIVASVGTFAGAADGIPATGVNLKWNLLAGVS